jgi:hypothetical protein
VAVDLLQETVLRFTRSVSDVFSASSTLMSSVLASVCIAISEAIPSERFAAINSAAA